MRSDISKVLVTTARWGSSLKNQEVKRLRRERIDEDYDGPGQTSMRPTTGGWDDRKQLNEYLNPLIRFLDRSVGRLWDGVYSDICRHNSRGSAVGEHIYQHLSDYVTVSQAQHAVEGTMEWSGYNPYRWYVDEDGYLRKAAHVPYRRRDGDASRRWLRRVEDSDVYHVCRNDGAWFELRFRPNPLGRHRRLDGFRGDLPDLSGHVPILRSLSRDEKAALGLV